MHNKKRILIILLTIILIILGVIGFVVWGVNTLSQNKAITTKIITAQIHKLLDLDSEVKNPRAYIDWDFQYKIRADKLTFINNKSDLVSVDDIQLDVSIPYLFLRKIYITQMNGNNLFMDIERYDNNKINIIEIFNITGFFKIYFKNSAISIDHYHFKFTDKTHKPTEKMIISGNNMLFSKFTLKKYFNFIMDGEIDYNNTKTPFAINYNAKIPTIKKDYNLEVNLPNFDAKVFKTYIDEFSPNTDLSLVGNIYAKVSSNQYFNIDAKVKNIKLSNPKLPVKFDFADNVSVFGRFGYKNKNLIVDELNVDGKDFGFYIHGILEHITKLPPDIDLFISLKENSNANTIFKLLPEGIPALFHIIDKTKKHNISAIVSGSVHARGTIGNMILNGKVKARHVTLGYGADYPESYADINFAGEKLKINALYHPNYNPNQYVTCVTDIKTTKPIVLDIKTKSTPNLDLATGHRALNVYSEIFHFPLGSITQMDITKGNCDFDISVKGSLPNVFLNGYMNFRDGQTGFPGLYGKLNNVSGNIDFAGNVLYYKNIKGEQDGVIAYVNGQTEIHKNGLSKIYLKIPQMPMEKAKHFIDNSSLIENVSKSLSNIQKPVGMGSLDLMIISDKDTSKEPYVEGLVKVQDGSCNIEGLAYRANNVQGEVDFDNKQSRINMNGIMHGVYATVKGIAESKYSNITVTTPNANIQSIHEFLINSPMFVQMKNSFNNIQDFSGRIKTSTTIKGNFATKNISFISQIDIPELQLKIAEIPEYIYVTGGKIVAQKDKIQINNLRGNVFDAPYTLNGTISNIGLADEKQNLNFKLNNLSINTIYKLIKTNLFSAEVKNALNEFKYNTGTIDINSNITKNATTASIKLHDVDVTYKKSGEDILSKSGEFFYSPDVIKLKNFDIRMANSELLIDGDIKNYFNKPDANLHITSNISENDFNKTLAPLLKLPFTLVGKIYANINLYGSADNWHMQMRAMLDNASHILYKTANLGDGASKFLFADISGENDDITIKTFDVFSSSSDTSMDKHHLSAQIYGKIKSAQTDDTYIEKLTLRMIDFVSLSFLNIMFYDENNNTPVIQEGEIKGDILIDGPIKNLSVLGNAEIKNAVMPSINMTIETMKLNFGKELVHLKDALINIAGSEAEVSAVLQSGFKAPIVIKELSLKSASINADKIRTNFINLFAESDDTKDNTKKKENTKVVKVSPKPPIIIEKGTVNIEKFIYNGLLANNFAADFSIKDNWQCDVNNLSTETTNGRINGNIKYNFYTTAISGDVVAEDVMANAFATTFLNLPNEIYGDMDAEVKFSTKGKTNEEMIKNLNGNVTFNIDKGRMIRLGSVEYMLRVANTMKGGISRLNLNAVINLVAPKAGYFDTISGNFLIKDGNVFVDKITSKSSELSMFLTGAYDMNNSLVNAVVIGQMPKESKESIVWLGSLGRISLKSLGRALTRTEKNTENPFIQDPIKYLNDIPGLKSNRDEYRFFVVRLKGNLYTEKYVEQFKWIK